MSYDIYLKEPVTGQVAKVPGHLMIGGTYKEDYHPETGTFTPALNTEAHLNITYNYGRYYSEIYEERGIEIIHGMSGVDSVPVLENMILFLDEKYKKDGIWITSKRNKRVFYDEYGNEMNGLQVLLNKRISVRDELVEYEINEGDTSYYWTPTAANAIRPLYQLIALAKLRPDCVWEVV